MPRRILVVSYYYPPNPLPGSHRWESMAQALRELGHEVTVLTTNASGTLETDAPWVIRTGDLQASPTLRRVLGRPPLEALSGAGGGPVLGAYTPEPPPIFTRGLVPDSWVLTWLPYAVHAARHLIRDRQIEVVITNSPPDSTHLLGLALGRGRPAWIADFDDGWRFEPLLGPWPTALQDRLDAALERRVATSAEALVGITGAIASDFTERYGSPAYEIPSGWDSAELDAKTASVSAPRLDPDKVQLVHTGLLSAPERRDPRGLFEALETLVREEPELSRRLRLSLAGSLTSRDRRMLDELSPAVRSMVNELGPLPQPEALALQRAADCLLLISTGPHKQVVTAKLSEYLLAERPILAVLSENEAARIIRETHTGVVVAPHDLDALRSALRSCLDGRLAESYKPTGLDRYVQPGPAREFEAVIEAAIARHAARPAGAPRKPQGMHNPRGHDVNLRSAPQMLEYEAIVARIAADRPGRILDWGCGWGQVTDLLVRAGLDVESFDYRGDDSPNELVALERFPALKAYISSDPVALPYPDGHFDAVLSCGVLEHVGDPDASLVELRRVLRPGGTFYCFKLPNRYSYLELIARSTGLYYHGMDPRDRLYTMASARALLTRHGFKLLELRRANMLPLTLSGAVARRAAPTIWHANRALARVPGLNTLATNVELVAGTPVA